MSDRLQALREKRAARAKSLHELVNKDNWVRATDEPEADKLTAEIEEIDGQISRINDANAKLAQDNLTNQVSDAAARIGRDQGSVVNTVFGKILRSGPESLNAEERATIQANLSVGTGSQGGFTVPTTVSQTVLEALKAFGGMSKVATVITTEQGGQINFPASNGTAEEGEIVAEGVPTSSLDPSFSVIPLVVYKFSSKIIPVTFELLQDSAVDIETWVRTRLVARLGRATNRNFTLGSGVGAPTGLMTAVTTGVVGATGETISVSYDDLINLQHSVDAAYRELGNCSFMMHDDSLRIVRKLKDGIGRPIFAPGYDDTLPVGGNSGAAPDRILGAPITINNHMPVMAANALSITYGDHSFYTIRDVMALEMMRYTDSAYASKGLVGFQAWMRSGGNLIDIGGAVKAFQNSAA